MTFYLFQFCISSAFLAWLNLSAHWTFLTCLRTKHEERRRVGLRSKEVLPPCSEALLGMKVNRERILKYKREESRSGSSKRKREESDEEEEDWTKDPHDDLIALMSQVRVGGGEGADSESSSHTIPIPGRSGGPTNLWRRREERGDAPLPTPTATAFDSTTMATALAYVEEQTTKEPMNWVTHRPMSQGPLTYSYQLPPPPLDYSYQMAAYSACPSSASVRNSNSVPPFFVQTPTTPMQTSIPGLQGQYQAAPVGPAPRPPARLPPFLGPITPTTTWQFGPPPPAPFPPFLGPVRAPTTSQQFQAPPPPPQGLSKSDAEDFNLAFGALRDLNIAFASRPELRALNVTLKEIYDDLVEARRERLFGKKK